MDTQQTNLKEAKAATLFTPDQFDSVVASAADLAIVLEGSGKVRDVVVSPYTSDLGRLDHWTDRDIRDFLAEDSLSKLEAQLSAYREGGELHSGALEINHTDATNAEFPVRYTLHRTGQDDLIVMLGRDLRPLAELQMRLVKAQLVLEKDYEKHRNFETRYRVVMETAREPLAIVDANTGRIIDANSACGYVLGTTAAQLRGQAFTQEFDGKRRSEFLDALVRAASTGDNQAMQVVTKRNETEVVIFADLFRSSGERMLLCRIEPATTAKVLAADLAYALSGLYADSADAIVFTDIYGKIQSANAAFLELCNLGTQTDVRGRSFAEFLARGSVDTKVLTETTAQAGTLRSYATRVESPFGTQVSVEINATHLKGHGAADFAFILRDTSPHDQVRELISTEAPQSAQDETMKNVMDLVGSTSLKDIVTASADVVEKICIETALSLTNNNRVAASEMLGLSRQSLYVKLRKYGLHSRNDEDQK